MAKGICGGADGATATACARYVAKIEKLPSRPSMVLDLLEMFRDPDRDIDRVIEALSYSPSLTADILRRCNSAALGGDEPVGDMFEVVTRLGFYEVYCIVVARVGAEAMDVTGIPPGFDLDAVWKHAVLTAIANGVVAQRLEESAGVGFTVGLLHDVGKPVLAAAEKGRYVELMQKEGLGGPGLVAAERAVFGVDHAMIGAFLLNEWKFPAALVEAVCKHHHAPEDREYSPLLASTILADEIAKSIAEGRAPQCLEAVFAGGRAVGLSPAEAEDVLNQTKAKFEKFSGGMNR